jgi:hypothetical protein
VFYALAGFALLLSVRVMVRRHLLDPQAPPGLVPDAVAGLGALCISFLVSIPLAFITPWAFSCWAIGPLLQRIIWRRPTEQCPKSTEVGLTALS